MRTPHDITQGQEALEQPQPGLLYSYQCGAPARQHPQPACGGPQDFGPLGYGIWHMATDSDNDR